ncbi:AAA ATPase [Reticulomyxa filosa]|uniref:AAA ATPase n=1 Tax=Reticulomyxa filosa TaxID=46433 RepID=X6MUQ7_RETFI|nr:AAA ATPase [Reticulomyxa filosa]|eukprot:ETO17728.1 AAA ATPase [Reticulomyxa filosa]
MTHNTYTKWRRKQSLKQRRHNEEDKGNEEEEDEEDGLNDEEEEENDEMEEQKHEDNDINDFDEEDMTYSSVPSSVQNSNERTYSSFSTTATKTQPTMMKSQVNEKDNPDHEDRKCDPNRLPNDTNIGKGIVRLSNVTAGGE